MTAKRAKTEAPNGKRRLIQAALRLSARGVSLSALGLREMAREAGLNHNTFYRHYDGMEDLARAAAHELAEQLMAGMKEVRRNAIKRADATRGAAEYFLDFVQHNPEPFIVGLRELHSTSTPMREVLQGVLHKIAAESVDQIVSMKLAPGLSEQTLTQVTLAITYYMFYRSLDYIEHPQQRAAIVEQMVGHVRMLFLGAAAVPAER